MTDPRGSSTRKKNKKAHARWEKVAQGIYELLSLEEFPENTPWDEAEDDDKMMAYAAADIAISLVDNLITPAVMKGMK